MKLPRDFDADWYRQTYPDVPLSGLDPRDHYLLFGKRMGRSHCRPKDEALPRPAAVSVKDAAPPAPAAKKKKITAPAAKPASPSPIIERPADFDPAELLPKPAPPRAGAGEDGIFSLEALAEGSFATPEERVPVCGAITSYARMTGLAMPAGIMPTDSLCGAAAFQSGETRIDNAWLAGTSKLRLMIAGGAQFGAHSEGWALRVLQAEPGAAGALRQAGEGILLPAKGPVFHDIALNDPLMPVLIELSDADGRTRAIGLIPFPSLLPGGMHGAELKALQDEANPMDAFWSMSERLLAELLGAEGWPDRSISGLSVDAGAAAVTPQMEMWLQAIFGLSGPREAGINLTLPSDCIPTIGALVSRQLDPGDAAFVTGPFLVADEGSFRPRWSVALPAGAEQDGKVPRIQGGDPSKSGAGRVVPIHLAIALRPSEVAEGDGLLGPSQGEQKVEEAPGAIAPMTMLVDSSDAALTGALVGQLRNLFGEAELDLLVRIVGDELAVRAALDPLVGSEGWRVVPADADPRDLAGEARHDLLLTISDRIQLHDPRTLPALCAALVSDGTVGSASCFLLGEKIIKKKAVLQPGTGGLFPSRISFATAPMLSFLEPDLLQALPDVTYPVAANSFLLTVWRREALSALPRPNGPAPSSSADIRIGLDLLAAGYRNLCTTAFRARYSGNLMRRDAIDPVGHAYAGAERWQEILRQVTVLRALF